MESRVGDVNVHHVEHGAGLPVLVLHGAGVDHREAEACFEPALRAHGSLRRIYPDLPGMGRTTAPASMRSADDVLELLLHFADAVAGPGPLLVVGHSAGAYYARGLADRRPDRVAGVALVCPLVPGVRDVPQHAPLVADAELGDEEFRSYFVVQTPEMLDRYRRFVEPGIRLVDEAAASRIGERWQLTLTGHEPFTAPVVVIAGRQDSIVGYAAAIDLLGHYPHATLAVVDGTGHALPHERPAILSALIDDWIARTSAPPYRYQRS